MIKIKLYGYCFVEDQIILDAADLDGKELSQEGAYGYIWREKDKKVIKQNFIGSYGLYFFQDGEY